jgi:hypothetical protein
VHDIGIVVAGEDVAGTPHIGGQLIDFVERPIDHRAAELLAPQVADDEIVRLAVAEFRKFQIDPADPEALSFQATDEMAADEPARSANQGRFCAGRDDKLNLPKNIRNRSRWRSSYRAGDRENKFLTRNRIFRAARGHHIGIKFYAPWASKLPIYRSQPTRADKQLGADRAMVKLHAADARDLYRYDLTGYCVCAT